MATSRRKLSPSLRGIRLGLFCAAFVFCALLQAQQPQGPRKILYRVAPPYPTLARSMALEGTVKIEVVVAPDGTVKILEVRGGHPVLTQAALKAIRQWKWEPTPHESIESVQVKFSPES